MILDKTYLGSTEIEKIYLGSNVVYELTPIVTNLYSWSDAGTPIPNEADAVELSTTNGWEDILGQTTTSSSSDFQNGSYAIKMTSTVDSNSYTQLNFSGLSIGQTYRFTFWGKAAIGNGQIRGGSGWVVNPPNTNISSSWTEYIFDVEANAVDVYFLFWAQRFSAIGDTLYLDNITMVEI